MQKQNLPIGVFDSGVGGVSVLRELVRIMPNENFIYIGDSKNAPYGTKSHEEIFVHAQNCADILINKGVKALVVACNTATSVCIEELRQKYTDLPVIGIEPALKPAVMSKDNPVVVVMATPLTLKEKKFADLCKKFEKKADIIPLPCPGLMELVEEGHTSDNVVREFLENCFLKTGRTTFDTVVLGCTHYPFVKGVISELHPETMIFDGGEGTARQVKRLLLKNGLLNSCDKKGEVVFQNTLNSKAVNDLALKLMNI